ncbi:MAG: PAS domain-containing sensor histidine kinase [Oculatellaceae cyanobacterium bins.114]|nr:PAS domain-containing sensor histidine kinase [Oculatellaceae cyanobacterium bins.114]
MNMFPNQPFQSASHVPLGINQHQLNVKHLESQLHISQLQIRQLLQLFLEAAWIVDADGKIIECNQTWLDLTTTTPGQSPQNMGDAIDIADRDRFLEQWQRASQAKTEFTFSCRLLQANPTQASEIQKDELKPYFRLRVIPIVENSSVRSWIGVCSPFTTDHSPDENLGKARVSSSHVKPQLQHASSIEGHFLNIMSHELRTPLNAILGFSQLLLRQYQSSLTLIQIDMVNRILKNAHQLLTLVDDILSLSQLEAGYLSLKLEEFDIAQVISAVIDEVQAQANRQQLTLISQLNIADPCVVNDLYRLRQVLLKVLYNALKFTELGEVYITLHELSSDRLQLTIRDTGIGIGQEDLHYIFERFRQVDQTITRRYSGTGLGLAIAHRLIELMNGSIKITSQLQQGTTVIIELPRQISASK